MAVQLKNKKKRDKNLWIPLGNEEEESDSNEEFEVMSIEDEYNSSNSEEEQIEEEEGEEEESRSKDWGNKKRDFYDGGSSTTESEGENWSDVEMQDEEAREIQASRMTRLNAEDFGMQDIIGGEAEPDEKGSLEDEGDLFGLSIDDTDALLKGFGELSRVNGGSNSVESGPSIPLNEEGAEGMKELKSELAPLLASIREKVGEVKDRMQVLLDFVKTKGGPLVTEKGMEYLDSKNTLLLMYIGYLCYYMMLKNSPNVNIKEHPILLRLVTLRTLMEKLKPLDVKLQPQIDRVLELAQKSSKVDDILASAPRPDRFVFEDDEDDEVVVEEDTSRGKSKKEENIHDDKFDEGSTNYGSNSDNEEDVYQIPKNIPVEFNDRKLNKTEKMMRELERERRRLLRSDIIRQMKSTIDERPEEVGKEKVELPQLERLRRQIKERISFEEDNMIRLPKTKKDKKEERLYKKLKSHAEGGVSTLEDLAQFAEKAADMAIDSRRSSLSRYLSNASKLTREISKSKMAQESSDRSITEKLVKRRKAQAELNSRSKYVPDYSNYSGSGDPEDALEESISNSADAQKKLFESNSYLQEVLKFNEQKKKLKQERKQKMDQRNMPNIDDLVDSGSRRASTKEMIKNKGLTRKRKKIEGNARVHNRLKYNKAMKRLKGTQRAMREYESSYSGESTGLKDNVKRSTNLT
ncbi:Sas10 C-terminal domain-containing protein [Cryptosporidium felis]|nr:Sas10 C-terminal domain-containing protein [Cryptosporidium felis]